MRPYSMQVLASRLPLAASAASAQDEDSRSTVRARCSGYRGGGRGVPEGKSNPSRLPSAFPAPAAASRSSRAQIDISDARARSEEGDG